MTKLKDVQIQQIKRALENKIGSIQSATTIFNKLWPQLELPVDMIYRLNLIYKDFYLLEPLESTGEKSQKIPTNKLSFVILYEDPLSIYCFSHVELYERPDLISLAQNHVNYGHSSLAFIKDKKFGASRQAKDMAKPVLLAGHLYFGEHEHLALNGGGLLSWTVESGHYRPTLNDADKNRIGFIKQYLPMSKFFKLNFKV